MTKNPCCFSLPSLWCPWSQQSNRWRKGNVSCRVSMDRRTWATRKVILQWHFDHWSSHSHRGALCGLLRSLRIERLHRGTQRDKWLYGKASRETNSSTQGLWYLHVQQRCCSYWIRSSHEVRTEDSNRLPSKWRWVDQNRIQFNCWWITIFYSFSFQMFLTLREL